MMTTFTIPQPNDMHLHVRQGDMLVTVVPHTAKQFGRAIIMPNTTPPITNSEMARQYREEIVSASGNTDFNPMMVLYMSPEINVEDLKQGVKDGIISAIKLYPFGVTTNSEQGAKKIKDIYYVLEAMQEIGIPMLVHGEDSHPDTDVFDREKVFYQNQLPQIMKDFPNLKIVCEHITTKVAAEFIATAPDHIGATITPQHLLCDRNDMLGKGINPHLYCKPILKRSEDRIALLNLVLANTGKVFAGTDSAPHTKNYKECACGCAGVYSAYSAMELYAEAFDVYADLSKPETQEAFTNFMSINAANFYGFEVNTKTVTISNESGGTDIPKEFVVEDETLIPYKAGEKLQWSMK